MEFQIDTLPNGIRFIHQEEKNAEISHCGLIINVGSRDETPEQHGMAHFLEHTLFKGTKTRKAFHILSRLDAVGGEVNAYTTKEFTCLYASFLNHHYERAIELLVDIAFHSVFPPRELEKEKEVILDEIYSYLDSPSEQIYDDFEEQLFGNHPLGHGILGQEKQLRSFDRDKVLEFFRSHYTTDNMVFSSVGNLPWKKLKKMVEKYLGDIPSSSTELDRAPFADYKAEKVERHMDVHQAHGMIGTLTYPVTHPRRRGMVLLNNVLGGPALNSRLNLNIREKYGFAYNIDSGYHPYSDSGVFQIYLGTDISSFEKSMKLIYKELKALRENKLGVRQLHSAKQQLTGQIAFARESRSGTMLSLGKSLMIFGRIDPLEEVYARINAITAEEVLEIANEVFDPANLSTLAFLPNGNGRNGHSG